MTNYSKWDKFAANLADSDDEADKSQPTVKVVGDNQAVKIGPDGYQFTESPAAAMQPALKVSAQSKRKADNSIMEPSFDETKLTLNGSKGSNYYWRQDRSEVILTVLLPADVKGKELFITFDSSTRALSVLHMSSTNILSAPLRYTVNTENMTCITSSSSKSLLNVDPEDWEVVNLTPNTSGDLCVRVLEITLRKVSPLPGAIFWWRSCFEGEAEIDVTKIAGRTNMGGSTAGGSSGIADGNSLTENDLFVQAQKMFLEKMKGHEKVEVDLSEH